MTLETVQQAKTDFRFVIVERNRAVGNVAVVSFVAGLRLQLPALAEAPASRRLDADRPITATDISDRQFAVLREQVDEFLSRVDSNGDAFVGTR